jgi:hypothetical protein
MNYSANLYRNWHTLLEQGTARLTSSEAIADAKAFCKTRGGEWEPYSRGWSPPTDFVQLVTEFGFHSTYPLTIRIEPTEREAGK